MWLRWERDGVAKRYDASLARLRKTAARRLLAEYAARGIVLTVKDGVLCRNRDAVIINGTAQRIKEWQEWFVEVLQEMPEK